MPWGRWFVSLEAMLQDSAEAVRGAKKKQLRICTSIGMNN